MPLPDETPASTARGSSMNARPAPGTTLFSRWFALAVAMGLGVTAVWLAWKLVAARTENAALRTERDLANISAQAAQNQFSERTLLAERMINDLGRDLRAHSDLTRLKVMVLRPPVANNDASLATVVWDQNDQAGLLAIEQMPPNAEDQDYQIWIADSAQGEPVNAGVFHLAPGERKTVAFKPDRPVAGATRFAISRETKGGTSKSGGTAVMLSR